MRGILLTSRRVYDLIEETQLTILVKFIMKGTSQGKSFNDRELAASVRTLALEKVKSILIKGEKHKLYAPVLLNLTRSLLPRLNEITGENGSPVIIELSGVTAKKYGLNPSSK